MLSPFHTVKSKEHQEKIRGEEGHSYYEKQASHHHSHHHLHQTSQLVQKKNIVISSSAMRILAADLLQTSLSPRFRRESRQKKVGHGVT